MNLDDIKARGLILIGCGKMGSAMLSGWLASGIPAASIWISDPQPSAWLVSTGVNINKSLPKSPAVCLIAVKPQIIFEALSNLNDYKKSDTLFISIAAGIKLKQLEQAISSTSKIIRAMPNTPSAVGKGITALIGNSVAKDEHMEIAKKSVGRNK
jgi:pyrroline-5-carboxylate reductase